MSCLVLLCLLPLALGQNIVQNGNNGSLELLEYTLNHYYQGPAQTLNGLTPNGRYKVEGWVKLLNDKAGQLGQNIQLEMYFDLDTGKKAYIPVGGHPLASSSDGWIHLTGDFNAPSGGIKSSTVYYQGPSPGVNFVVDSVSVTPLVANTHWRAESDATIERIRKSDINFHSGGISDNQVEIDVIQTNKSFAFGTAVKCCDYLNGDQRYIPFINKHFNGAVTENALKWTSLEPQKGNSNYDVPINTIKKLRSNGVEHWDVNNENLHGFWYQNTLNDRDYNLDIFRNAHQAGPNVKMFPSDYSVVLTEEHRDTIAQAGFPIWVTELDVINADEHKRADWYEISSQGVLWSPGCLRSYINAAGQRYIDLTKKQWMANENHILSQSCKNFKDRGFHGEYTIKVKVNLKEVPSLAQ
ncbi:endo-1,4-beta-xylanase 1-like [Haliotis rubra]|uniref:endo-1,4-beta-xylanase 1-like n=1 Tax=Haliotis rubra TaxID=36100 RepID=UPI001EE600C8|nr:endo-1,4-beta-xylanase 1-like [Haliotis rubra]